MSFAQVSDWMIQHYLAPFSVLVEKICHWNGQFCLKSEQALFTCYVVMIGSSKFEIFNTDNYRQGTCCLDKCLSDNNLFLIVWVESVYHIIEIVCQPFWRSCCCCYYTQQSKVNSKYYTIGWRIGQRLMFDKRNKPNIMNVCVNWELNNSHLLRFCTFTPLWFHGSSQKFTW